jgi:hypothetical protein
LASAPLPIAPLTEPVTVKAVALEKATVIVWATAAEVSAIPVSVEELGFVLGEAGKAELPRDPVTEPVTVKAAAELNWTVSVSATVAPIALLIVALLVVVAAARRPAKSKALID